MSSHLCFYSRSAIPTKPTKAQEKARELQSWIEGQRHMFYSDRKDLQEHIILGMIDRVLKTIAERGSTAQLADAECALYVILKDAG